MQVTHPSFLFYSQMLTNIFGRSLDCIFLCSMLSFQPELLKLKTFNSQGPFDMKRLVSNVVSSCPKDLTTFDGR